MFARNAHHVLSEADALIVYGWSPSAGVGQEIIWAAQSGLPVLYVEPQGHPPSRQVAGTPGDLTIIRQSTPDHLKDEIRRWVRRRRHQLEPTPVDDAAGPLHSHHCTRDSNTSGPTSYPPTATRPPPTSASRPASSTGG